MSTSLRVTLVAFMSGSVYDQEAGLLGWITIDVGGLVLLHGITLRRSRLGTLSLSFPKRKGSRGVRYPVSEPLDDDARREIERQVFAALDDTGDLP